MKRFTVSFEAALPEGFTTVIAPGGLSTPDARFVGLECSSEMRAVKEGTSGQIAHLITPPDGQVSLTYTFEEGDGPDYPDVIFAPRASRFTRFADDLIDEVAEIAPGAAPLERMRAIACATAERFTYGHPDTKFNDGMDEIPALGCGLVEGSCVDINTYFIASLRAAGLEAGYVTGFFFPAEKNGACDDGHCWVVTRCDGQSYEWDIAHHLKLGTRNIHPGLNPKPGFRAACFHSMGLNFPEIGLNDVKALIEPVALRDGAHAFFDAPRIRLRRAAEVEA